MRMFLHLVFLMFYSFLYLFNLLVSNYLNTIVMTSFFNFIPNCFFLVYKNAKILLKLLINTNIYLNRLLDIPHNYQVICK